MSGRRVLGAVLAVSLLLGLLYFAAGAFMVVRPTSFALSPDGRTVAQLSIPVSDFLTGGLEYHLTVSDLAGGASSRRWLRQSGEGDPWLVWSDAPAPHLAVFEQPGPGMRLLHLYSPGDRSWRTVDAAPQLAGRDFLNLRWTPGGKGLLLVGEDVGVDRWIYVDGKSGSLARLAHPPERPWFWLSEREVVSAKAEKEGPQRFFLVSLDAPDKAEDVTDRFPLPDKANMFVRTLAAPEILGVRAGEKVDVDLVLWDVAARKELGRWSGCRRTFLSADGRRLYLETSKALKGPRSFVKVDIPSLASENLITMPAGAERSFELLAHPDGSWHGVAENLQIPGFFRGFGIDGPLRIQGLGAAPKGVEVRALVRQWFIEPQKGGLWFITEGGPRLGVFLAGKWLPSPALMELPSGRLEPLPVRAVWAALFRPGMLNGWVSLAAFLLSAFLFLALFFRPSPTAPALGLFFWSLAWLCPPMGVANVEYLRMGSGGDPDAVYTVLMVYFFQYALAFLVAYAALSFASNDPGTKPFFLRHPRLLTFGKAITLLLPVMTVLLVLLALLDLSRFSHWEHPKAAWEWGLKGYLAVLAVVAFLGAVCLAASLAAVFLGYRRAPTPEAKARVRPIALGFGTLLAWALAGAVLALLAKWLGFKLPPFLVTVWFWGLPLVPAIFGLCALCRGRLLCLPQEGGE